MDWWIARLGKLTLPDITPDHIRLALNEYANEPVKLFIRGQEARKDTGRWRSNAKVIRMRAMLGVPRYGQRCAWMFVRS